MRNCPANQSQIESACMSFRHDFGLLDEKERGETILTAVNWLEAWMKEGLTFKRSDNQYDFDALIGKIDDIKDTLHNLTNMKNDSESEFRKQIIMLQAENSELKRQLEQSTSPEYLNAALGNDTRPEEPDERISVLSEALHIARRGFSDWLHIYAPDLCDPVLVEQASERVHEHGTLAYIAEINTKISDALRHAGDNRTINVTVKEIGEKLPTIGYLSADDTGWEQFSKKDHLEDVEDTDIDVVRLVDGDIADQAIQSLRYDVQKIISVMEREINRQHERIALGQEVDIKIALDRLSTVLVNFKPTPELPS